MLLLLIIITGTLADMQKAYPRVLTCSSDSDCSGKICNNGVCVDCLTDAQCRNNNQCNAICNNFVCQVSFPLICNVSTVCYEVKGECLSRCNSDSDCAALPTVLHYPNTGVCDKAVGKCYDCMSTPDCKPDRNETCNAKCSYNSLTKEYLCGDGSLCQNTLCVLNHGSYECNFSNLISPMIVLIIISILI